MAPTDRPGYHIPPEISGKQGRGGATHWMYDVPAARQPQGAPPANGYRGEADTGSLGAALVAGAVVAFIGGLAWAGVVIATHWDIGFLAWISGAATGRIVVGVYRARVPIGTRVFAGLLAAGGILVGKYVIVIHEVRALLSARGVSIGYFNTHEMSVFIHNFSTLVRPIYYLWFFIAFLAAFVAAGRGRARST